MSDMKESGERLIRVDGVRKDLFLAVLAYLYGEDRQKVLKHVISECLCLCIVNIIYSGILMFF